MDKWIVTIFYKWTVLKETWKTNYFGYPNKYDWGKLSIQYIHVSISNNSFIFTHFFKI